MPQIDTRYGHLLVPDTETDVIGRFLARYGEWAWLEARFVASVLDDGARILDVGAFVGTFGLGVGSLRSLSFLCFVEANSSVARLLEENVKHNSTCPAVVVEAVVGSATTPLKAGQSERGNLGSTSFCLDSDRDESRVTVPPPDRVITLAELRTKHGEFDLIKLDVEGMELDIVSGNQEYLKNKNITLWIECNENLASLQLAELLFS